MQRAAGAARWAIGQKTTSSEARTIFVIDQTQSTRTLGAHVGGGGSPTARSELQAGRLHGRQRRDEHRLINTTYKMYDLYRFTPPSILSSTAVCHEILLFSVLMTTMERLLQTNAKPVTACWKSASADLARHGGIFREAVVSNTGPCPADYVQFIDAFFLSATRKSKFSVVTVGTNLLWLPLSMAPDGVSWPIPCLRQVLIRLLSRPPRGVWTPDLRWHPLSP